MSTTSYVVGGITCGHCKNAIESEVSGVEGVSQVTVDIDSRHVTVVGEASDAAIRAAIIEAGYDDIQPA